MGSEITTWKTPAGTPAAWTHSANSSAASGVWLAGFSTTGQPAAMAGAIFRTASTSGKFHGEIAPTTPIGVFTTMWRLSGTWVGNDAGRRRVWLLRRTSAGGLRSSSLRLRPARAALPFSCTMMFAISALRRISSSAMRCKQGAAVPDGAGPPGGKRSLSVCERLLHFGEADGGDARETAAPLRGRSRRSPRHPESTRHR